ncbi:MAG: hypothetical protein ACRD0C_20645 [Acidimicrobiia bacterium]
MYRPVLIALFLGLVLAALSALADAPVAVASLLAAFLLGMAFPHQAALAGGAVMVPQVLGAVVIGVGESIGLTLVALVAGLVAVGFSALLGFAGALVRRSVRGARG